MRLDVGSVGGVIGCLGLRPIVQGTNIKFWFLSFLSCLVRSYLGYVDCLDMVVVNLFTSHCASLALGSCLGFLRPCSWDLVRLGGLRSGSPLVNLVYRMAYLLVRVGESTPINKIG